MWPFGNKTDMTTRRKLLIGAAASLIVRTGHRSGWKPDASAASSCRRRGSKAINGDTWDAQTVIGVMERDKSIRREDAIRRAELLLGFASESMQSLSSY
jgi:hypothetical protein